VSKWETIMAYILIVDDDDVIRETLFELLSTNYKCETAATAEEALAKLENTNVTVLLTDITLPGLSGRDLLAHVQQRLPQTAVIVISGMSDEDQAQMLLTMGAFDYLLKPFRLEAVEASVKRALESRNE
jgi:DNA-binding NtrC family response regulator